MWEARSSHSRSTGLLLLGISGISLAVSFLTVFEPFEILALVSFVMGVFLISVELEPRVKLIPSAESLMGPLVALSEDLVDRGFDGNATYVPKTKSVVMRISGHDAASSPLDLVPVGRGLSVSIERELGPLKDTEISYLNTWVPKALEKGLGLAEGVRIKTSGDNFEAAFERPFVRPLCVREDFNQKVCKKIGCPLVSSLGEILASSTGKEVGYMGCTYDRSAETSHAVYQLKRGN